MPLRTRLTDDEVARFTAQRFRFPGVEVQARLFRQYPLGEIASHVIGYIGRINHARSRGASRTSDDAANYNGTDHIGKEGLEKQLRAPAARHHRLRGSRDARPAAARSARCRAPPPIPGNNLILSIDIELQKVVEEAFGDQRGALVAIEPETGDVLAYVSRPGFDPNLFVDGIDTPELERTQYLARQAADEPAAVGHLSARLDLQALHGAGGAGTGQAPPDHGISRPRLLHARRAPLQRRQAGRPRLRRHVPLDRRCPATPITTSSATTWASTRIHDFMQPFGFGQPDRHRPRTRKDRRAAVAGMEGERFKRNRAAQKWFGGDTISIGIGQGYNNYTPLQLAHAVANLANNGVVMKPHLVKMIEDGATRERTLTVPKESRRIPLKQENIDVHQARDGRRDTSRAAPARAPSPARRYTSAARPAPRR